MAILQILTGADRPVLRKKTTKVPKVTKEISKLLKDMAETVHSVNGAGLAAPQVGQSIRVCIALIAGRYTPLINPEITARSRETDTMEEGCLSIPGVWLPITRSTFITLKYRNAKGRPQERKLSGFDARVVQHEVDHLEGVLIVDYQDTPQRLPRSSPDAS